jgi:hypothetical protein
MGALTYGPRMAKINQESGRYLRLDVSCFLLGESTSTVTELEPPIASKPGAVRYRVQICTLIELTLASNRSTVSS